MTRGWPTLLALLASGAIAGCAPAEHAASARQSIVGGTAAVGAHPGVGALIVRRSSCGERPAQALCTVTLIAPDVVVTAGHCVDAYRDRQLEVLLGDGLDDIGARYRVVVEHVLHPLYDEASSDFDVALLVLSAPVDVPPVALEPGPLDGSWVGRQVLLVGFGEAEASDGVKREGTAVIEIVDGFTFRYGPSPAMTCRGDSGGPAFVTTGGEARLVGVTSAGDVDCVLWGIDARVDAHRADFIEPALLAIRRPEPVVPVGALCEASCIADDECPSSLICSTGDDGEARCAPPSAEPGSFGETCAADAQCASGACAPFEAGCACYEPCAPPVAPPGGCRVAPRSGPLGGCALAVLAAMAALRRSRRC